MGSALRVFPKNDLNPSLKLCYEENIIISVCAGDGISHQC